MMPSQSVPSVQLSAENPSRDAPVPRLYFSTSTKLEILRGQLKFMPCLMSTCNRSLISPEVLDTLGIHTAEIQYTLTSCSGSYQAAGRIAHNLTIQSLDKGYNLELPTVIECPEIPIDVTEIPTPDVAQHFTHLKGIANMITPI